MQSVGTGNVFPMRVLDSVYDISALKQTEGRKMFMWLPELTAVFYHATRGVLNLFSPYCSNELQCEQKIDFEL